MEYELHGRTAAVLRESQPLAEASLATTFASVPERLAAEKAAIELTCLIYENLPPSFSFVIRGQDLRPTVSVLSEGSPLTAGHDPGQQLLLLAVGNSPAMTAEMERVLQKLEPRGLTKREQLLAENPRDSDETGPALPSYSFLKFPIVYAALEPH